METEIQVLTGLLAVKELRIKNLEDRIKILEEHIKDLEDEINQLYAYINQLKRQLVWKRNPQKYRTCFIRHRYLYYP